MSNLQKIMYSSSERQTQSTKTKEDGYNPSHSSSPTKGSRTKSPKSKISSPSIQTPKKNIEVSLRKSQNNDQNTLERINENLPIKKNQISPKLNKNEKKYTKNGPKIGKKGNGSPEKSISPNKQGKKIQRLNQLTVKTDDTGVPFKQKSHSLKSVSIPQHLLSSEEFESDVIALLNKKVQSTKNSSLKNEDPHRARGLELVTLYNRYIEGKKQEDGSLNKWNKFFPSTHDNLNKDTKLNFLNEKNQISKWPKSKMSQKSETPKHVQIIETQNYSKSVNKTLKKPILRSRNENGSKDNDKIASVASSIEKESKGIMKKKQNSPEVSPSKGKKEGKKKLNTKISPRVVNSIDFKSSSNSAQAATSLKVTFQDTYSVKNNDNIEFQNEIMNKKHQSSLERAANEPKLKPSPLKNTIEVRLRTGSAQTEFKNNHFDLGPEDIQLQPRPKTSKYSDPNLFKSSQDYTSLTTKSYRGQDSQTKEKTMSIQVGKENCALSTRSLFDKQENCPTINCQTEGNEPPSFSNTEGSIKFNKENLKIHSRIAEKSDKKDPGDQILADLLKGNNLKELNPNAKFLLLRKQIQEKRNKLVFKSADWNTFEQFRPKHTSNNLSSPARELNSLSKSPIKDPRKYFETMRQEITKENLYQLLFKTKKILTSYQTKEKNWQKEKKTFQAEINYLKELLKKNNQLE